MELQEMEEKLQNGDVLLEVKKKKKKKRRKKKRKREKRKEKIEEEEEEEVELSQDPLEVLGRDIMLMILKNLDARSVALSLLVSRAWHGVASSDSIWSAKCEELWLGKAHIPHLALVQGLPKLAAYSLSIMDGKRVVPEYWRNLDPYWKGTSPLMHRYFHTDGSQTADPGDKETGLELGNVQRPLLLLQCS
ncbi:F-box domain-containing protein [Citrus sinensis]|uniref:F-box domain-containing protein n=1 Tax=Citrus sinensis TaxID=2711 RepID=A0ACB8I2M4_CITSI|nr:F-box domain-containing protein [Citrus sinensis]